MRAVVVDNGSHDQTAERARQAGAEVISEARRGYGTAVQRGIVHLEAEPPDVLVILDADHADSPELLTELVAPIALGLADLVQSDRTATAEPGALTPTQIFGNGLAVWLMHLATGHRYRDMGPFRAIRWSSLQELAMEDPTWGWNVEMQMKAVQAGLRILEIPMPYRKRRIGTSKISGTVIGSARAGYRILATISRYV